MAKIILANGVINVEEDYNTVVSVLNYCGDLIELTEIDTTKRHFDKATGVDSDYRILVNTKLIQCVKP